MKKENLAYDYCRLIWITETIHRCRADSRTRRWMMLKFKNLIAELKRLKQRKTFIKFVLEEFGGMKWPLDEKRKENKILPLS